MKKTLFLLSLLFTCSALSGPVATDHFLYPRDIESLWLTGIERGLSFAGNVRNLERCATPERLTTAYRKFHCEVKENSELVLNTQLNYDQKTYANLNVFGETHTEHQCQLHVAKVIKDSPHGFFQTLALEMFNSSAQAEINWLIEKRATRSQWRTLLAKHWQYDLEGYLDVIEAALGKDMKILALDDRRKERDFQHEDSFSEDLIYRDAQMAQVLLDYFTDYPEDKVVFVTGKLHSFKTLGDQKITISEIVKEGMKTQNPTFDSRHYLLFGRKKTSLLRSLNREITQDIFYRFSGQIKKYADGAFLF